MGKESYTFLKTFPKTKRFWFSWNFMILVFYRAYVFHVLGFSRCYLWQLFFCRHQFYWKHSNCGCKAYPWLPQDHITWGDLDEPTPLHLHRKFNIPTAFRNTFFGPMSFFLSSLAPTFFKNLYYSSRFHLNVQLPSRKTQSFHNSVFHKGPKLWKSLPFAFFALSSRQFRSELSTVACSTVATQVTLGIYTFLTLIQLLSCACLVWATLNSTSVATLTEYANVVL